MKFKIGQKYLIQFWDHCKGPSDVILCEIMIWITEESATSVRGSWWRVINTDEDTEESNREMVSIIKSTIKKKRLLK